MGREGDRAPTPHSAVSTAVKSVSLTSESPDLEKHVDSSFTIRRASDPKSATVGSSESVSNANFKPSADHTHRKLKPRHIQLIGIGGTIGTALFVQIGTGLMSGGPANLFMAFTLWYVYS
ncbi:hypothetical protein D8B26_003625 [Coccidioides posadasii str. Silveira]|uniref:Amino acid permease/ SLC12A domain-containing protein n=2 Tax=Coccidioides posadasii TaxID=199306 RepID=E9D0M3_COCPS|nr:conserved hypothetical protein [Coccidioides posadasii str. Silveira]KMM73555.1 hypothetical protein CPAG_09842 [Coccidioides posadasii RMSCC 3488]QVM08953.1 hypothetical protein D8B26_003625 [Coccidioides posadasii str. Silveira]